MIPYGRQSIDEEDIAAVVESLQSDWLTQGPAIGRFESGLAGHCQSNHAIACNSGTAALHMAYAAAGIGPGDVVVVPANTFLATANAAIYLGAEVRFCDVDPSSGLMTPELLDQVLTSSVKAVVPVHFAGQACDMPAIVNLMRERCPDAILIEDASHAIGGSYANGLPVGMPIYSSMITFSFHPVKHIAAGEGGAVTTASSKLRSQLESFRCHGMTKDPEVLHRADEGPWYYEMHAPGFNYRIPEAACALAASQLKKIGRFVARRREIASFYLDELANVDGVKLPAKEHLNSSAWHLFCLHIDFANRDHSKSRGGSQTRAKVMSDLRDAGVGTQVHYFPVPLQPFYQERYRASDFDFPGAMKHYRQALSIPMFPAMTDQNVEQVVSAVKSVLRGQTSTQRRAA